MSVFTNTLRYTAIVEESNSQMVAALIKAAADRIDELEASPAEKLNRLGLSEAYEARGVEIERLRVELASALRGGDRAGAYLAEVTAAAGCCAGVSQEDLVGRVTSLVQSSKARDNLIAKATAKANDYLNINKGLTVRIDELNNQDNQKRHVLHAIADKLGAGSRNSIPALDWYLDRIRQSYDGKVEREIIKAENLLGLSTHETGEVAGAKMFVPSTKPLHERLENAVGLFNRQVEGYKGFLKEIATSFSAPFMPLRELPEYLRKFNEGTVASLQAAENFEAELAKALGVDGSDGHATSRILNQARALGNLVSVVRDNITTSYCDIPELILKFRCLDIASLKAKAADWDQAQNARWDKQKTDALQSLLQKHGFWPSYNNVEGLKKFDIYVVALKEAKEAWSKELTDVQKSAARWRDALADAQKKIYALTCELEEVKENSKDDLMDATKGATFCRDKMEEVCVKNRDLNMELTKAASDAKAARDELDLAVGAIKRMHTNLLRNKDLTGIWPEDDRFRAKLDDIEWCLSIYVSKYCETKFQRNADTKFLKDISAAIDHEIDRRNK